MWRVSRYQRQESWRHWWHGVPWSLRPILFVADMTSAFPSHRTSSSPIPFSLVSTSCVLYEVSSLFSPNIQIIFLNFFFWFWKDIVDPVKDQLLSRFVVQSHIRSHPVVKAQTSLANAQKASSAPPTSSSSFETPSGPLDTDGSQSQDLPSQPDATYTTNHMPEKTNKNILSQELLRKYILYRCVE